MGMLGGFSLIASLYGVSARTLRVYSASVVESVISAIGVIPAIGSFENAPSAYDTAPLDTQ